MRRLLLLSLWVLVGWSLALIGNASGKQSSGRQEIYPRRFR